MQVDRQPKALKGEGGKHYFIHSFALGHVSLLHPVLILQRVLLETSPLFRFGANHYTAQ